MAMTWSFVGNRSVKVVCTTGTETFGQGATDGLPLPGVGAFEVFAQCDVGQTFTATPGGVLQAWLYNDVAALWGRCPDLDQTISAPSVRVQGFVGYTVVTPRGKVAYSPSGVTLSAGGLTIYLIASGLQLPVAPTIS